MVRHVHVGLHGFRCCLHVASQSLKPLCCTLFRLNSYSIARYVLSSLEGQSLKYSVNSLLKCTYIAYCDAGLGCSCLETFFRFLYELDGAFVSRTRCLGLFLLLFALTPHGSVKCSGLRASLLTAMRVV